MLKHMNIISEIHTKRDIRLFMSILLHPFPEFANIMKAEHIVSLNPSPLVFTFHPSRYQPIGLYHILLAQLLRGNKVLLHDQRYRNRVILFHKNKQFEILSTPSYLEIRVDKDAIALCVAIRELIQNEIETIISTTPHMSGISANTAFYCTRSLDNRPDTTPHLVEYPSRCQQYSTVDTVCNVCPCTMGLEDKHRIWFEVSYIFVCITLFM